MLTEAKRAASDAARRAGFAFGGLLAFCVGLGFLTLAAWTYLNTTIGTLQAALIIGGLYAGAGCILFAVSMRTTEIGSARGHAPMDQKTVDETPPLMEAFLFGVQAGTAARQARR